MPNNLNESIEKSQKTPLKKVELQADIHYYFENGFMVFTEAYHLQRGYCCSNGCRHCPYKKT
jgi:hypothetical protein